MLEYRVGEDVELVQELLNCPMGRLAEQCGLSRATLERWVAGDVTPSQGGLAAFYDYAYSRGIRLTRIKAQLYQEDCEAQGATVLFHGSKEGLDGPPSIERGRERCDFGRGFYCGERFEQPAMFVSNYPHSCLYVCSLRTPALHMERLAIELDWMLAVAWFRGKLGEYADHPMLRAARERIERADCVVAPIADNRMFEIIDSFAEGELTDIQCRHCLSATDLGRQYVLRTEKALSNLRLLERCFLSGREKTSYLESRDESSRVGRDKTRAARRQYRNEGQYIEELLS